MNLLRVLLLLPFVLAIAGAEEPRVSAAQAAERVVLPRVAFRDAPLREAVEYFQLMSRRSGEPASGLNIVVAIPPGPSPTISIQRENGTLLGGLKEAAAQAACEVQEEPYALVIRPKGAPPLPAIRAGDWVGLQVMRKKLDDVVFPRVDFREATIRESIEFIVQKTKQLDPDGAGVSMVLKLDDQGRPAAGKAAEIPGIPGLPAGPAGANIPPPLVTEQRVTLQASEIPLLELLRYVAGLAGLEVTVEKFAIVIQAPGKR